jgi:hypothetical protein
MPNPLKKRINEATPEEKKLSSPTPEIMTVVINPKYGNKIKVISHSELAMIATVLDFSSDA